MYCKNDPIGVFDSGVGGISVLGHLYRQMPGESFLYYSDTAHAPYGIRSTEEVRDLAMKAAAHLLTQGIKALVVACNTATAAAIADLRQKYPSLTVVGIEPAVKPAAEAFPGGNVGVLATPVTLREEKFQNLAERQNCAVISLPAPGLADLVEAGKGNSPEAIALLSPILEPWKGKLDALVLGCTHYPFAQEAIRCVLGDVPLFDGGEGTARETRRQLEAKNLLRHDGSCIRWDSSAPANEALCRQLLMQAASVSHC